MRDSIELEAMPPVALVQVMRFRPNAQTQVLEPWPVASIHIDAAGRIQFIGDASKAYEPLLRATHKAATKLARQSLQEALSEAHTLRDNLDEPTPSPLPSTALTPDLAKPSQDGTAVRKPVATDTGAVDGTTTFQP